MRNKQHNNVKALFVDNIMNIFKEKGAIEKEAENTFKLMLK
jgi:hypothetical protein